jgi:hypothetical protein
MLLGIGVGLLLMLLGCLIAHHIGWTQGWEERGELDEPYICFAKSDWCGCGMGWAECAKGKCGKREPS